MHEIEPQTAFETETLDFINDWLEGRSSFIQQTSGSTGQPKVIEIQRSQMMASAMMTIKALQLPPSGTVLLCLSPQYIGGKMLLVRALLNKMNIYAIEPSANPLKSFGFKVDFASMTPMQLGNALDDPLSIKNVNNINQLILGGSSVSRTLHKLIQGLSCTCYSTYGMTETVSHIALQPLNGPNASQYYRAFEEIELNLDDRGCLTIRGAVTNFETVITNDRVNLINDKQFEWLGRIDNVINSGGIKIQSEKVEKVIHQVSEQLDIPNQSFIYGLADEELGQRVVVIIEGKLAPSVEKKLKEGISTFLSKYEQPKAFLYVEQFKRTATGKINRKETATLL